MCAGINDTAKGAITACASLFEHVPGSPLGTPDGIAEALTYGYMEFSTYPEAREAILQFREEAQQGKTHSPEEIASFIAWLDANRPGLHPALWQRHATQCVTHQLFPATNPPPLEDVLDQPFHNPHEHLTGSIPVEVMYGIIHEVLDETLPLGAAGHTDNVRKRNELLGEAGNGSGFLDPAKFKELESCTEACWSNFDEFEKRFKWQPKDLSSLLSASPTYWNRMLRYHVDNTPPGGLTTLKFSPKPARLKGLEAALETFTPDERQRLSFQVGLGRWETQTYAECEKSGVTPAFSFCSVEQDLTTGDYPILASMVSDVDVYGDENVDPKKFAEFGGDGLKLAHRLSMELERPIHTAPHAGEAGSAANVWTALIQGAVRVGHGRAVAQDPLLMAVMADLGVPIEVSLFSNEMLYPEADPNFHPIQVFEATGVPYILSTDDAGKFNSTIQEEYIRAHEHYGIPASSLEKSRILGLTHSSVPEANRLTQEALSDFQTIQAQCR